MLVQSASTMGLLDKPADHKAIAVMGEVFLDLTSHLSQPLTEDLVVWADYVLVMEYRHAHHIRKNHPVVGEKLMMLGSFGGFNEIEDPIGSWKYKFRKTRDQLSHCVEGFVDRLPPVKQSGQKISI